MKPALDPRIDAYIAARAAFAQPIMRYVRDHVHKAAPQLLEDIKWRMPAFTHKGKLVIGMAGFKEHAALTFWHGSLVTGGAGVEGDAMGAFGRITSVDDLPPHAEFAAMIAKAAALAEAGVKQPTWANRRSRPELPTPPTLTKALAAHRKASAVWDGFAPSHRRDYCEWIGEAKRPETLARRVEEAIGWIAEGKQRHGKHQRN